MKLYYSKGACSLAVRIVMNEIGVECDYESVDLKEKKTESDHDFRRINDKGAVPTLQLKNGDVLTENAVILQYIADLYKAEQVLPKTGELARYRILEWVNYVSSELHKTIGLLFSPLVTPEIKDNLIMPMIKTKLSYVNHHLENKEFLYGEHFTLPDAYLFVILLWTFHFKIDLQTWPNLANYFTKLSQRPSVKMSLQQESIALR